MTPITTDLQATEAAESLERAVADQSTGDPSSEEAEAIISANTKDK